MLRMLPAEPMLRILPVEPMLRILPAEPMLKMLPAEAMLAKLTTLKKLPKLNTLAALLLLAHDCPKKATMAAHRPFFTMTTSFFSSGGQGALSSCPT